MARGTGDGQGLPAATANTRRMACAVPDAGQWRRLGLTRRLPRQSIPVFQAMPTRAAQVFPFLLATAAFAGDLHAQMVLEVRNDAHNAGGLCQGALPTFVSALRARPLAVANESATTAFVTCSLLGGSAVNNAPTNLGVVVHLSNRGVTEAAATCTLVDGLVVGGAADADYVPKTVSVPAGATRFIDWDASDLPGSPEALRQPNLNCALPPGFEVNRILNTYREVIDR